MYGANMEAYDLLNSVYNGATSQSDGRIFVTNDLYSITAKSSLLKLKKIKSYMILPRGESIYKKFVSFFV